MEDTMSLVHKKKKNFVGDEFYWVDVCRISDLPTLVTLSTVNRHFLSLILMLLYDNDKNECKRFYHYVRDLIIVPPTRSSTRSTIGIYDPALSDLELGNKFGIWLSPPSSPKKDFNDASSFAQSNTSWELPFRPISWAKAPIPSGLIAGFQQIVIYCRPKRMTQCFLTSDVLEFFDACRGLFSSSRSNICEQLGQHKKRPPCTYVVCFESYSTVNALFRLNPAEAVHHLFDAIADCRPQFELEINDWNSQEDKEKDDEDAIDTIASLNRLLRVAGVQRGCFRVYLKFTDSVIREKEETLESLIITIVDWLLLLYDDHNNNFSAVKASGHEKRKRRLTIHLRDPTEAVHVDKTEPKQEITYSHKYWRNFCDLLVDTLNKPKTAKSTSSGKTTAMEATVELIAPFDVIEKVFDGNSNNNNNSRRHCIWSPTFASSSSLSLRHCTDFDHDNSGRRILLHYREMEPFGAGRNSSSRQLLTIFVVSGGGGPSSISDNSQSTSDEDDNFGIVFDTADSIATTVTSFANNGIGTDWNKVNDNDEEEKITFIKFTAI